MSDRIVRAHRADLEIRSAGDGRTIVGICCPFGQEAVIAERGRTYTEVFERGAYARSIAERGPAKVKLLRQHNRDELPIGRAVLLREDAAGLYGEFHVAATHAGDDVLELVRSGSLDAFSVGFRPLVDRWNADRTKVQRREVALAEVSVVAWGAYSGAVIEGVRSIRTLPVGLARRRLDIYRRTTS